MFQSLRQGNQVYILHKDSRPYVDVGTIVKVSEPMPKYQMQPMFGQPQEMVVDITVNVDNREMSYQKLPASADIADFGTTGIVISVSREAMNSEVTSLKSRSIDAINSVDYHRGVIESCDEILSKLNPEFAERQKQRSEIDELKERVMKLVEMNEKLMGRLDSGTST